ncbi:MAG: hypothetical protein ACPLRW_07390 [Moorellales bacterium]
MRGLNLKGERGAAALVIALILIPLLIAVMAGSVSMVCSVTSSDIDLQEAAAFAAKAAATMVGPGSQAAGAPRIRAADAHQAFRRVLADNLGLDPSTMSGLSGSFFAGAVRYWLVVYNGDDQFASEGAVGARLYWFDGSAVTETGLSYSGFPAAFAVGPAGITQGAGGVYSVELDSPGVVALVEADVKRVAGDVPMRVQRWAAARVVVKR